MDTLHGRSVRYLSFRYLLCQSAPFSIALPDKGVEPAGSLNEESLA